MERGLFWLPLLIIFFWLAWQGSKEYKKVEAYRHWAEQFDRAKYDIYAVLGQKDDTITWGKPTAKGLIQLQTFSLLNVSDIQLVVNNEVVNLAAPPEKGRAIALKFNFADSANSVLVPFTEIPLAAEWAKFLQGALQKLLEEQKQ
jgi:hypothetical protein